MGRINRRKAVANIALNDLDERGTDCPGAINFFALEIFTANIASIAKYIIAPAMQIVRGMFIFVPACY